MNTRRPIRAWHARWRVGFSHRGEGWTAGPPAVLPGRKEYGRHSGRDESAYLVRQLDAWEAANVGVWVDPDGGLEDDFDDMGVASWDGGAWNDDGA